MFLPCLFHKSIGVCPGNWSTSYGDRGGKHNARHIISHYFGAHTTGCGRTRQLADFPPPVVYGKPKTKHPYGIRENAGSARYDRTDSDIWKYKKNNERSKAIRKIFTLLSSPTPSIRISVASLRGVPTRYPSCLAIKSGQSPVRQMHNAYCAPAFHTVYASY